jgi:hypothetical protein
MNKHLSLIDGMARFTSNVTNNNNNNNDNNNSSKNNNNNNMLGHTQSCEARYSFFRVRAFAQSSQSLTKI